MKYYYSVFLSVIFLLAHISYVQAVMNVQLPFYDGESYMCTQNSSSSPTHNTAYTMYDLDFSLPNRSIVVAASDGIMYRGSNPGGFGTYAKVDHGNGKWTMYGHLSGYIARDGDSVVAGQPIAYSGNTGLSIGSGGGYHLHFGVHNGSGVGNSEKMNVYGLNRNTNTLNYFATGLQNETEFVCGLTSGHDYEARPIGAVFSDFQCKNLSGNNGILCWKNNPTTCEDGENHVRYYRNSEGANQSESTANTWKWCAYDSGQTTNVLSYIEDGYGVGGIGPGFETTPTDSPTPGLPDFILRELQLTDSSGNPKYVFDVTNTLQMHSWSENIGDADWAKFSGETEADDIYVKFYLSKGYKEDSHSEWVNVSTQQIKKGNLDVGEIKHEWGTLNLSTYNNGNPITPGIYNIVACVDRKYDKDNGDGEVPEIHKSNNCSTEAVFTVNVPNYLPTGWLDRVDCTQAQGWAKDPNTESPIDIHIYSKNQGSSTEVHRGTVSASTYRGDVGSHGFSWTIPTTLKTGAPYTLNFYAIDSSGGPNPLIGQSQLLCAAPVNNLYPAYRAFHHTMQSHFYTVSESEKNTLHSLGWLLEGVAFYAHNVREPNTFPVYRFFQNGRGHFYTISEAEKNHLVANYSWLYRLEGIAFYAYSWQVFGTSPIYRLYSHSEQNHFYTASQVERNYAVSYYGHVYEGIAFYAHLSPPK